MQKNGLSSDCIYEIHESSFKKSCLLLITNQGFSQFDVPNRKFHNYSIENGFPLTAVNENALYITRDGEVFLGGVQGMISFHEKALFFTPKSYNILLSRLIVNGKLNSIPDIVAEFLRTTKPVSCNTLYPILPRLPYRRIRTCLVSNIPPQTIFLPTGIKYFIASKGSPMNGTVYNAVKTSSHIPT